MSIGKISMKRDHEVEWSIAQFCSYSMEDLRYTSDTFTMSGSSNWYFLVYPNGQTKEDSVGWISLYLMKTSDDRSLSTSVRFIFGMKKVDGTVEHIHSKQSLVFEYYDLGCGYPRFLERSKLQQRESELLASETLTFTCTLWTEKHFEPTGSLETLSREFAELFISKRGCDASVKVMDVEFPVHKWVLCARSPVLAAMFETDMKEKRTGLVEIPEFDPQIFEEFLAFLYSGKFENVSINVFELYKIADKYDVPDLKCECVILIISSLSVENVLDIAIFGSEFDEPSLRFRTEEFFKKHYREIISTTKWDDFILSENATVAHMLIKAMAR